MKVFIKEYCRDVTIRIFGMDGEEHTKDFFEKYFYDVIGVEIMTDEERSEFLSEAEFSIEKRHSLNFSPSISEQFRPLSTMLPLLIFTARTII